MASQPTSFGQSDTPGILQEYISRQLGAMGSRIAEDRAAAERLAAETAAMKAETAELQTKVRVSQTLTLNLF